MTRPSKVRVPPARRDKRAKPSGLSKHNGCETEFQISQETLPLK